MRLRDDSGLSLTELLVVLALMGMVLATVYLGINFGYRAQAVAETQTHFAKEISAPLRVMDKAFSQSTVPPTGTAYNEYLVRLRMPIDHVPGRIIEHEYEATADGRLLQRVYQISGANRTLLRTVTWSKTNTNRAVGQAMFTYFRSTTPTTNVVAANNVLITLTTEYGGQVYRDRRRVFFRNR
jgi:prepilin-type N-terminal cleavage/methylation domain-containing protein